MMKFSCLEYVNLLRWRGTGASSLPALHAKPLHTILVSASSLPALHAKPLHTILVSANKRHFFPAVLQTFANLLRSRSLCLHNQDGIDGICRLVQRDQANRQWRLQQPVVSSAYVDKQNVIVYQQPCNFPSFSRSTHDRVRRYLALSFSRVHKRLRPTMGVLSLSLSLFLFLTCPQTSDDGISIFLSFSHWHNFISD